MFAKILGFLSLMFLVNCNQGRADLERCGCEDSNRRQYLVTASVPEEEIGDILRAITDFEQGGGFGGGGYDPVRVRGVCAEMETRRVVFCADDTRDFEALRDQFPNVNFNSVRID